MAKSYVEKTAPAVFCVSVSEAKTHLRITNADDDTYIQNCIYAAIQSCEVYTNRYFNKTTLTLVADKFTDIETLYKSPLMSITHIKYYDTDGTQQTWAPANYIEDASAQPPRVLLAADASYPDIDNRDMAVEVEYVVGYGTNASDVPFAIRQAVLIVIGNLYENRQEVIVGRVVNRIPMAATYLLKQYKVQVL